MSLVKNGRLICHGIEGVPTDRYPGSGAATPGSAALQRSNRQTARGDEQRQPQQRGAFRDEIVSLDLNPALSFRGRSIPPAA